MTGAPALSQPEAPFLAPQAIPGHVCGDEPAPVAPVRLHGRMVDGHYQAENSAWKPFLTQPDKRLGLRHDGSPRLAGRDPMQIPLDILRKAGHPNRSTEELRSALCNYDTGDPMAALIKVRSYRDIPAYCDACSGCAQSRRKCAMINCPFFIYRFGKNPHSPRRGIKPTFGAKKTSVGTDLTAEAEPAATVVSGPLREAA